MLESRSKSELLPCIERGLNDALNDIAEAYSPRLRTSIEDWIFNAYIDDEEEELEKNRSLTTIVEKDRLILQKQFEVTMQFYRNIEKACPRLNQAEEVEEEEVIVAGQLSPKALKFLSMLESRSKSELLPCIERGLNDALNDIAEECIPRLRKFAECWAFDEFIDKEEEEELTTIVDDDWGILEKKFKNTMRCFPGIVLAEREDCLLIKWLAIPEFDDTYILRIVSLIPSVVELGIELNQFKERGGLLLPASTDVNYVVLNDIIGYSRKQGECHNRLDACFLAVCKRLRESNNLTKEDIENYGLLTKCFSPKLLRYLVELDPMTVAASSSSSAAALQQVRILPQQNNINSALHKIGDTKQNTDNEEAMGAELIKKDAGAIAASSNSSAIGGVLVASDTQVELLGDRTHTIPDFIADDAGRVAGIAATSDEGVPSKTNLPVTAAEKTKDAAVITATNNDEDNQPVASRTRLRKKARIRASQKPKKKASVLASTSTSVEGSNKQTDQAIICPETATTSAAKELPTDAADEFIRIIKKEFVVDPLLLRYKKILDTTEVDQEKYDCLRKKYMDKQRGERSTESSTRSGAWYETLVQLKLRPKIICYGEKAKKLIQNNNLIDSYRILLKLEFYDSISPERIGDQIPRPIWWDNDLDNDLGNDLDNDLKEYRIIVDIWNEENAISVDDNESVNNQAKAANIKIEKET